MDYIDMFEMRKVNKHFKRVVDEHMPSYYHFNKRTNPIFFVKETRITREDFIKAMLLKRIFHKEKISKYCFNILNLIELNCKEIQQVYLLVQKHMISIFFSKECGSHSQSQLDNIIGFKNMGFADYYAVKFGSRQTMIKERLPIAKQLLDMGVSNYFSGKIVTEFSDAQIDTFFDMKKNTDIWYVAIANIIEEGF
jgi:hypothetical protein